MILRIVVTFAVKIGMKSLLLRYPAASLPTVRLRHLPTAATRSGRFICHRQRSHRSPSAALGMTREKEDGSFDSLRSLRMT